jgi:kinesin family member 6/9
VLTYPYIFNVDCRPSESVGIARVEGDESFFVSMKETIRIYVRLKALDANKSSCQYETSQDPDNPQNHIFQLSIPKDLTDGYINNTRELFRFHFDGILESESSQSEVFRTVAKPIVDRALDGFNGTLFAYGQTGSGKTFTVTGKSSHHPSASLGISRGIIPRTLSYIFSQLQDKEVAHVRQPLFVEK